MKDISMCHPRLQELAAQLTEECKKQGLLIKIGECWRTVQEQDALYAQGRTQPGAVVTNARGSSYSSQHQWGIAFDFYRNDGKGAYNEDGDFFTRVGAAGKKLGLGWGGEWKSIVDKPHLYLPDWGSTTVLLKQQYKTPDDFKKTWNLPASGETKEGFIPAGGGGFWSYMLKDKTLAKADWFWLTERTTGTSAWYLFDDKGIMLTGYQSAPDGRKFFLCPDKGVNEGKCMVTNDQGELEIAQYDWKTRQYHYKKM